MSRTERVDGNLPSDVLWHGGLTVLQGVHRLVVAERSFSNKRFIFGQRFIYSARQLAPALPQPITTIIPQALITYLGMKDNSLQR